MVVAVPTAAKSGVKDAAAFGGSSWILHERARRHHWNGVGSLSIKSFFSGRAQYKVGCGYHAVDQSSYLVLNEGQRYEIEIDSRQPVESFCLFFAPEFASDVQRSLSTRAQRLLDDPERQSGTPVRFFEKNYAHDELLSPSIWRLRRSYAKQERGALAEQFHGILERLLRVHELAVKETESLDNVRAATRQELFRRVCRARDYANAMFAQSVTLAELARVACMSPNHLLRTFRQLFHQTPHQFLVDRRLEEAKRLLANEELTVTDICLGVGFESLGSFSTLFRKQFGCSPSEWRALKR
jgi:AraC family transcriptional regulator